MIERTEKAREAPRKCHCIALILYPFELLNDVPYLFIFSSLKSLAQFGHCCSYSSQSGLFIGGASSLYQDRAVRISMALISV